MRARLPLVVGIALACVASALYAFNSQGGGLDYKIDAGPPIDALIHGDLDSFFALQPLMGSFSLLLRAPFAALATIGDGSQLLVYRLGALPCLLAAGLVALWVERLMAEHGRPLRWRLLVAGALLVNPLTLDALRVGHPEEFLGAALCVAAVIAAVREHSISAAVLLGLALATKQWAVLAIGPVLLALPGPRLKPMLVAGAIAAALTLPFAIGNLDAFQTRTGQAAHTDVSAGFKVTPLNVWWPVSTAHERTVSDGGTGTVVTTSYTLSPELAKLTHPLIVVLAVPLSLLFWRRREGLQRTDALALLALLFLLRCLLDPLNFPYYGVPLLLSIAAWDGLRRVGDGAQIPVSWPPLVTLYTLAGVWLSTHVSGAAALNAAYLAWALPLCGYLALRLYAPSTISSLGKRVRASWPSSVTATRSSIRTPSSPAR